MKKNILITGGTSGIGFNAAKTLVKNQDNNLILIGKNINKGELTLRKLKEISNNKNISFLKCVWGRKYLGGDFSPIEIFFIYYLPLNFPTDIPQK